MAGTMKVPTIASRNRRKAVYFNCKVRCLMIPSGRRINRGIQSHLPGAKAGGSGLLICLFDAEVMDSI
jgi:hypothetical protein